MKIATRFLTIAFVTYLGGLTFQAQAQTGTIEKKESGTLSTASVAPARQGLTFRNGKVMLILPKGYAPLLEIKKFPNGSTVSPNGQYKTVKKEELQLREGDRLDLEGNLTRNPVTLQQSTTVSGDTTGFGDRLIMAQQLEERINLLQRKREILAQKNEILETTVKKKPQAAKLEQLDAQLAKLNAQLLAEEKKLKQNPKPF